MGFFGCLVSFAQFLVLEGFGKTGRFFRTLQANGGGAVGGSLSSGTGSSIREVLTWWSVYVSVLFGFYASLFFYLWKFDATIFNLSILTAGIYALLFDSLDKKNLAINDWLYGAGFILALAGAAIYEHQKTSSDHEPSNISKGTTVNISSSTSPNNFKCGNSVDKPNSRLVIDNTHEPADLSSTPTTA